MLKPLGGVGPIVRHPINLAQASARWIDRPPKGECPHTTDDAILHEIRWLRDPRDGTRSRRICWCGASHGKECAYDLCVNGKP